MFSVFSFLLLGEPLRLRSSSLCRRAPFVAYCKLLCRRARRGQEEPGGSMRSQEVPWGPWSQEEPGGARMIQEEPGGARRYQEEPGAPRGLSGFEMR